MGMKDGNLTFTVGAAALAARVRVKITGSSTTSPPQVEVAGAGEAFIGVTEYAAAIGDLIAVRPINKGGSQEVTAAGAFAVGAALYGAAAGKMDDAISGSIQAYAVEAGLADGDIVEVVFI